MSTTLPSNMKYRDPFTQSGYADRIQQNIAAFNGQSAGGIVLRTNRKPGDYDYAAFFKNASGVVTRQDQTSTSDATAIALQQGEVVDVKLNRRVGPLEWTRSSFLKPGMNENALRVAAGEFAADGATQDMLSSGLAAAVGALSNQAVSKVTADASLTTQDLVDGLAKMGDAANRVAVWVMHSKAYYDLVKEQAFTTKIEGIANFNVQTGTPVTLNRPVLVTDDASLAVVSGSGSGATTSYKTLGLASGGIVIEDTEGEYIVFQEVTGKEQIIIRMQGEYAYNLGVKGFTWDVTNGGKNPAAATLATGSNWDTAYNDVKSRAGVVIVSS